MEVLFQICRLVYAVMTTLKTYLIADVCFSNACHPVELGLEAEVKAEVKAEAPATAICIQWKSPAKAMSST